MKNIEGRIGLAQDRFGIGMYSSHVAAKVGRIRYQNFQAWAKANLLYATRIPIGKRMESVYSYRDLLKIRLIIRLRQQGAKAKQIRVALHTIETILGEKDAWMRSVIFVDKSSGVVVAFIPEKPGWNPIAASKGPQKMAVVFFPDLIKELKEELVPIEFPYIEIDPEILGGAPIIKGTRISVEAVASAGEDATFAYPDLTKDQIANARAYEEFLEAS